MTNAIATTIDHVEVNDQAVANPLANLWLGFLAVCLGATLFCTVVLLAWPIVAQMAAG